MSRFHINKKGVPSPCRAKAGNCPLGGDEQHFGTKEEAEAFVANEMSSKHGLLGGIVERAEVLPYGEDGYSDYPLDEDFLESDEIVENAEKWANSEEAEKFLRTGELDGVFYTEADLIKSYEHFIGPDSQGYSMNDEISGGLEENSTIPSDEIQKEVVDSLREQGFKVDSHYVEEVRELTEKQKTLLEEAGQIENINHRMFAFYNKEESRYESFDLDTKERIILDEHEFAAAVRENPYKEYIIKGMREDGWEGMQNFMIFSGGIKSLASFFKRKIGTEHK